MSSEGLHSKGRPTMTIRRGEIIMRDGEVTAAAGSGRILTPGR
jgi:dihydroorotase-like cyclic amidohydrolase